MTGGMLRGSQRLNAPCAGCGAQDGGYHVPYAHAALAEGLDMPSYRRQAASCLVAHTRACWTCTSCPACVAAEGLCRSEAHQKLCPRC